MFFVVTCKFRIVTGTELIVIHYYIYCLVMKTFLSNNVLRSSEHLVLRLDRGWGTCEDND